MATSRFNLKNLLNIEEGHRHPLGDVFLISGKSNKSNQKDAINSYINNYNEDSNQIDRANSYNKQYLDDEDSNTEVLGEFQDQYSLEEESDQRRHIKKKLVKKKKAHLELEAPPLPVDKVKELTTVSKQMPASSFSSPNKQQLREAILWAEVLGEPRCKKRHRR